MIMVPVVYTYYLLRVALGFVLLAVDRLWLWACGIAIVLIPLDLLWRLVNIIYPT